MHDSHRGHTCGLEVSCSKRISPLTVAENNAVSVLHTTISESCTTQSVVKVNTVGEASMMTDRLIVMNM